MNGEELAAAIKDISPREPVILLTGFADLIHDTGEYSKDVDLVVSKPARLDDLRRAPCGQKLQEFRADALAREQREAPPSTDRRGKPRTVQRSLRVLGVDCLQPMDRGAIALRN